MPPRGVRPRKMTDYFARLGYEVRDDADGSRVLFADRNALFRNLPTDVVRRAINHAMQAAVPYFAANAAKSELAIEPRQVKEVAFRVTVSWLSMYASWRSFYPDHREQPLTVGAEELRHPRTFDQCYDYCKKVFGADFRHYVAALLGLTDTEYARIEKSREEYWNK
jgi:hypothetical protein